MNTPTHTEVILGAWSDIGGWVAAMVLAAWVWRQRIVRWASRLLDVDGAPEHNRTPPRSHVRLLPPACDMDDFDDPPIGPYDVYPFTKDLPGTWTPEAS
jgi:hypothetical protein